MDIKVIIFEDNKLFRDAIQAVLTAAEGYKCVGTFSNANNWQKEIFRTEPDVILMDIEMPGMNGIEATRVICDAIPAAKILIQTVFNDSDKIFQALCAGASGYILKNDEPQKYLDSIREVFNGGAPVSASVAKKLLGFFTNKNVILVAPGSTDFQLSEREKELLKLMVEGHNYKAIAEKAFISYETVRTHVKHIYKKLHVASRSEAVMLAIQKGLS